MINLKSFSRFCSLCALIGIAPTLSTYAADNVIAIEKMAKEKLVIQPFSADRALPEQIVQPEEVEDILAQVQVAPRDESYIEIMPASAVNDDNIDTSGNSTTHTAIRLTPDKSELLRLDKPAATVIVGNPLHLSVLADSVNTLILVAKAPGATHFTALDQDGEVIMARHVIVAAPQKKYMRIRRSCATAGDNECLNTQVYYCPDMCHEIMLNVEQETETNVEAEAEEASSDLPPNMPGPATDAP